MKSWVKTRDGWKTTDQVKFLDIRESFHGDEMEFEYNGEVDWSLIIISRSQPGS